MTMELIRGLQGLKNLIRGCVATVGNFDGVHRGHQAILRQLADSGKSHNSPTSVVIFEPQPQEYFRPEMAPTRLMSFREKFESLRQYAVDYLLCLRFDHSLANLSASKFVKEILVEGLGVEYLVIGDDFHFGKDREGNFAVLEELGIQYGFGVERAVTREMNGSRISSTWIRHLLSEGNMEMATELLGHPYSISGRVIHGDKRGRDLGYPTINMKLKRLNSPVTGIYATRAQISAGLVFNGITSIGTRPVFGGTEMLLESHLFEFNGNLYGSYVSVEFLKKVRQEQHFNSVQELKEQIKDDIEQAKYFFKKQKTTIN